MNRRIVTSRSPASPGKQLSEKSAFNTIHDKGVPAKADMMSVVARYLEKKKLGGPEQRMSQIIKVFKDNPFSNFIDAAETGEQLKREHNLDDHANIRVHFETLRAKNVDLKNRVEQRIIEQAAQALDDEAALDIRLREAKLQQQETIKKQRLAMFDEVLAKMSCQPGIQSTGKLDLETFIRKKEAKTVQGLIEHEIQLMKEEEADRLLLEKNKQEPTLIEKKEEFVSAFEQRISKMLAQLRGKKSRKTQAIEFLRKKSTGRIKEKAEEERLVYEKQMEQSKAPIVKKLMDDYSRGREQEIDSKLSAINAEVSVSTEKLPLISKESRKRLYASSSYEPLKPNLPRLEKEKNKKEKLIGQQSALTIIKSCYKAKKENDDKRAELVNIFRTPRMQTNTKESTRLLNSLLSGSSVDHKPAMMDHSLKKYYQRQNKFVSYRMYRENYLTVNPKDGFVHVVESDEK